MNILAVAIVVHNYIASTTWKTGANLYYLKYSLLAVNMRRRKSIYVSVPYRCNLVGRSTKGLSSDKRMQLASRLSQWDCWPLQCWTEFQTNLSWRNYAGWSPPWLPRLYQYWISWTNCQRQCMVPSEKWAGRTRSRTLRRSAGPGVGYLDPLVR